MRLGTAERHRAEAFLVGEEREHPVKGGRPDSLVARCRWDRTRGLGRYGAGGEEGEEWKRTLQRGRPLDPRGEEEFADFTDGAVASRPRRHEVGGGERGGHRGERREADAGPRNGGR